MKKALIKQFYAIEKYEVKSKAIENSDLDRFFLFTCVEGNGKIVSSGNELEIKLGDSILIPASLGEYTLEGNFTLLKSYVPDLEVEKSKILSNVIK